MHQGVVERRPLCSGKKDNGSSLRRLPGYQRRHVSVAGGVAILAYTEEILREFTALLRHANKRNIVTTGV
jgi:hypothetical protein